MARLNGDAIAAMEKQGLKVVKTDPAPWRAAMEKTWPVVRGGVVPAPFFDQVKAVRECSAGPRSPRSGEAVPASARDPVARSVTRDSRRACARAILGYRRIRPPAKGNR